MISFLREHVQLAEGNIVTLLTRSKSLKPKQANYCDELHETSLSEVCRLLWNGKLWIMCFGALFACGAGIYAVNQPNLFQSYAVLHIELDPYLEAKNVNPVGQLSEEANNSLPFLTSSAAKSIILRNSRAPHGSLDDLIISKDRAGSIRVLSQSTDASKAFESVSLYAQNINRAFKYNQLKKVNSILVATKTIINDEQGLVQQALAERYAQLLFKQAILESPDSELVKITTSPMMPKTKIKPNIGLTVILGTLLGAMLGVILILFRSSFYNSGN